MKLFEWTVSVYGQMSGDAEFEAIVEYLDERPVPIQDTLKMIVEQAMQEAGVKLTTDTFATKGVTVRVDY